MKKYIPLLIVLLVSIAVPMICILNLKSNQEYPNFTYMGSSGEGIVFQKDLTAIGIEQVAVIDWSPDGEYFAIGTYEGQIFILDAVSGELVNQFHADQEAIFELIWSPDSTLLLSGSNDLSVRVWNPEVGGVVDFFPGKLESDGIYYSISLAWSPDGQQFVFTDHYRSRLIIRSLVSGENAVDLEFSAWTNTISWFEESIMLFTGEEVLRLDLETLEFETIAEVEEVEVSRWNKGRYRIWDSEFSPDGQLAFIDSVELNLSDVLFYLRMNNFSDISYSFIYSYQDARKLSWSDDGESLAVGTWRGEVVIVSDPVYAFILGTTPDEEPVVALSWSPDGQQVVAVSDRDFLAVFTNVP